MRNQLFGLNALVDRTSTSLADLVDWMPLDAQDDIRIIRIVFSIMIDIVSYCMPPHITAVQHESGLLGTHHSVSFLTKRARSTRIHPSRLNGRLDQVFRVHVGYSFTCDVYKAMVTKSTQANDK